MNEQKSSFKTSNILKTEFNSSKSFQNQHQKFIILNKQSLSQKQKQQKQQIKDKIGTEQQSIQEQMKQSDQMKNSRQQTIQNQSDNQSKINSYYNTKSSFGIRQSSCNYPSNSNITKKQDFQQIKLKGKQQGKTFGNQTHKALKNPHLNTQTDLKIINTDKINNTTSLRQAKNGTDILRNEDLQIRNQKSNIVEDQKQVQSKLLNEKQEEYITQNENEFQNIEKRQEKTEQKEDLSNSFQIDQSENKTKTISSTLQKKIQNAKQNQKFKKQDQIMIPKDQKLQSDKTNHAQQNQLIKQQLFDLEMTNPIRKTGDFKNNQEMDDFLKKQIINIVPASDALASMNRDKISCSTKYINDKITKDLNIKSQDGIDISLPKKSENDYFQSKEKIQKPQIQKIKSKIDEMQFYDEFKFQKIESQSNHNFENEGINNAKVFKTPFVVNKKSMNQIDQLLGNHSKIYENSSKSNYQKYENNNEKLPDIFKNNFQIQSKSEQKLFGANLNNNMVESNSKKHQKSHDQLAIEIQRNVDISSAVKSNEHFIKEFRQNNLSRGENLNFEFQKFNRIQDAKSENGINLSPSRQLSSDQIQQKSKLKYNELLKMNADIKKKNIQFLNDKLGKMNRAVLQGDSNSVCYQNDQSNDTNNSINFKMINDEEEINQIQNNSYDSLLPNKNINGSFETYSNKILPQSVSLNIYSQKFLNQQKSNKTKRNQPTTVDNQSYSSLEQQNKNYDQNLQQDEMLNKGNGLIQNNSTVSLNYKDQISQEALTDIQQIKQKEKKLKDESRHGPGTANTHGGYMRQNYKKQQLDYNLKEINVNFKDQSLQCQSEIMNMNFEQNSSAVNQNFQQISYLDQMPVYNINSDFDRSFEIMDPMNFHNSEFHYPNQQQKSNLYRQNQELNGGMNNHQMIQQENNLINFMHYQNKGAIGEGVITDDMTSIPSIHSIPVIRNQKSQATYRHGHQKISEVLNKYYHNNYGNSSLQQIHNPGFSDTSKSEVYRNFLKIQQSQASAPLLAGQFNQEIYSQMNDHQINATQISQLSHDSEMGGIMDLQNFQRHPGTKQEVYRNKKKHYDGKDGAFSGDDRHPFNGPKLHLFRKGQSKSSQAKLRKIKRSQQNIKLNEINSLAGYSQIPGNEIKQNLNNHDQDIYNDINNQKQKYDNDLNNSVQNGSSLKNQGNLNQLTKNGHINISEILNGKIKLQPPSQYQRQNRLYTDQGSRNSFRSKSNEGDAQFSHEYYKEQLQNNEDDLSYNQALNDKSLEIVNKNIEFNQQMEYDSDSQNCRSQFTTICQNPGTHQDSMEQQNNQQIIIEGESLLPQNSFVNKRQSQVLKDINKNIIMSKQQLDVNQSDFEEVMRQQSQERKSMEDDRYNELNTSQKTLSNQNTSIKPLKNTNMQGSSFQHPKVGKNSKHPQVFRNNINQLNSQKGKKSIAKIENENGVNMKTQMINLTFNNNFPIEIHHSKSHQNLLQEQQINNQQLNPGFILQSNDKNNYHIQNNENNENKFKNISDISNEVQQNDNVYEDKNLDNKQQINQQLKDQNTIFATTFEGFNQQQPDKQKIENDKSQHNSLKSAIEKNEVQKQGFNVQKYTDEQNDISTDTKNQVNIKVRFNENFDYQNSDIDKNQFKKAVAQNKTELKSSLSEQQIQYKRDQVHQNKRNTFAQQSNDPNIKYNDDVNLNQSQTIGINSINSVMSLAMPIQNSHKIMRTESKSDVKSIEMIQLETEKMNKTHCGQMEGNRIETSSEMNGVNLNNTQKSHSIAQTPCFAETPNTTDQFKGYRIDVTD